MTALLLGTAIAVASLCYVLYPLYRDGVSTVPRASAVRRTPENPAVDAGGAPVCEKCGPRPEGDAKFCSNCGAALTL